MDAGIRALDVPCARDGTRGARRHQPPAAGGLGIRRALRAGAGGRRATSGCPPLHGAEVGGASDGNFTAGIGVPTLDGLGAVGGGAHADHEHVVVAELEPRTRLLAALIAGSSPIGGGHDMTRSDCLADAAVADRR